MPVQFPPIFSRNPWDTVKIFGQTINGILRDEQQPERWEVLEMPAFSFSLVSATDAPGFSVDEIALEFTATGQETVIGSWRLPNKYKFASQVVPHINAYHITAAASTAASVTVWQLDYRWYNASAATTGSWNAKTITHTFGTATRSHSLVSFGSITGSVTMTMGSIFKYRIHRLGANAADALEMSVFVDSVGLSYQADVNRGAALETAKWP